MITLDNFKKAGMFAALLGAVLFSSCKKDDEPPVENEEEVITDVKLIFTNTSNANDTIVVTAQDPDGEGVEELAVKDTIELDGNKTYRLTYEILNKLESPAGDIAEEIAEEDLEHQIFYSFTNNAFSSPAGNGNIDNSSDDINYNDTDANNNPVGLSTDWTVANSALSYGNFTVRLQHQPDLKSTTSGATDGDTDFELQFALKINEVALAVSVK